MHPVLMNPCRCVLLTAIVIGANLALAAVPMPLPAQDEFHFVVLGDSQFHDPATYNRMIDDVRLLQPAFVIQVGDMIEGYVSEPRDMEAEWQRFGRQIAPLAPIPFLPVPGNHDLYNAQRQSDPAFVQLYERIWGDLYYSFSYRNAQFFVLNTDAPDSEQRIDPTQWRWFGDELAASTAEHVFVFMHRPPSSLEQALQLHELLRGQRVRNVFYGHHHHYHFEQRDGIGYVMTNAAANGALEHEATGNFDHFLMVSVRDAQTGFAVVHADAIETPAVVHPSDNYDLFDISRKLAPQTVELIPEGNRYRMRIPLENPGSRVLTLYLSCHSSDDRWQFAPLRIPPISLQPGERQTLDIEAGFEANRASESLPYCEIQLPFSTSNGGWLNHTTKVTGAYSDR